MKLKSNFNKQLNIASLENYDKHGPRVHTLLQSNSLKQPSVNAYLGARYSRSADSIVDIAREIKESGTDASKRLETIFQGYGHKSVGDMAGLFVCLENIPMFLAQRLFYMNPVHSGQERSTRYQNFQAPIFQKLPKDTDPEIRNDYEAIFAEWMKHYTEMLEPTKEALKKYFKPKQGNKSHENALQARAFDTARFFLPIGLKTSMAMGMSARSWAELIGYLRASRLTVGKELGEMLFILLTGNEELKQKGYEPEADGLIRHTDANHTRNNSTKDILEILKKTRYTINNKNIEKIQIHNSQISPSTNAETDTIKHYLLLSNPLADLHNMGIEKNTIKQISKVLFANHNHHNQIGTLAQSGAIMIEGFGDYGSILKDINRHRSLERIFPLLEEYTDVDAELNRPLEQMYFLCDYLEIEGFEKLRKDYSMRFNRTYEKILNWKDKAKRELSENIRTEFTKYLLPHAHACRYRIYGSVDDWQYLVHLRTRNGGHIAYRKLTYDWLEKLAKKYKIFSTIQNNIPKPETNSRKQFFDRS